MVLYKKNIILFLTLANLRGL